MEPVAQVTQAGISYKIFIGRGINNIIEYPVNLKKNDKCDDDQHNCRSHNMPAQNFKMVKKAHFTIGRFVAPEPFKKCFSFGGCIAQRVLISVMNCKYNSKQRGISDELSAISYQQSAIGKIIISRF